MLSMNMSGTPTGAPLPSMSLKRTMRFSISSGDTFGCFSRLFSLTPLLLVLDRYPTPRSKIARRLFPVDLLHHLELVEQHPLLADPPILYQVLAQAPHVEAPAGRRPVDPGPSVRSHDTPPNRR